MGTSTTCSALFCTVLQLMPPAPCGALSSLLPPLTSPMLSLSSTLFSSHLQWQILPWIVRYNFLFQKLPKNSDESLHLLSTYHIHRMSGVLQTHCCNRGNVQVLTVKQRHRAFGTEPALVLGQGCMLSWGLLFLVLNCREVWGRLLGRAAWGGGCPEPRLFAICKNISTFTMVTLY